MPPLLDRLTDPNRGIGSIGGGGEGGGHLGERPVASWTEADVRTAMTSLAYLDAQHPDHRQVQRDVRAWFGRRYGIGPVSTDATGRAVRRSSDAPPKADACPVQVRGYARDGGKVEVRAYCRERPTA
jgi:hypothetical protein